MKIGMVCYPAYGGSGVVATELGIALARRGHKVHFVSHALPFRLVDEHPDIVFHEVDVTSSPLFKYPPYTVALAGKLAALSRTEELDLIHVHYAIPHAVAAYLARQVLGGRSPKVVTTLHGTDITLLGIDACFHEVTRFAIDQSDAVTAVSRHLAEETRASFKPRVEIQVILNFVNGTVFSPALRNPAVHSLYACAGEALVGHLSNFRPVKRIPDVVRVFHLLQKKIPARLLMIGEGPGVETAQDMAAELGISGRVSFLGPVTRVAEVLAQLDLFLLPSEHESFGLAALEAMACGVPVVCTRAGGVPEVVEHGVSGLLCDVSDVPCMARAAAELLKDPRRHRAMSAAARKRAVEAFPEERVVPEYEGLYRQLLE
ncbi:MAG: N-acetyl-alpha-D-glucosaminyl L-malate synthase BshA [Planctomycetes bacterium]|nr:N-acetyl-alpha-D-glucosaminyl L-malate synthase BshA [Planctomycetota bacterium]